MKLLYFSKLYVPVFYVNARFVKVLQRVLCRVTVAVFCETNKPISCLYATGPLVQGSSAFLYPMLRKWRNAVPPLYEAGWL